MQSQNFSINQDDSIYFVYSYNPIQTGVDIGKITFYNNSIIDSETVLLKGYAGIPVIQIPFQTVSFWEVELGITKDTTLTVRNLGVDTLFIDSIRTSNSVFNYNYENNFISPWDSLSLHLSFTPTSLAYYEAKLILFTNNYSSPDSLTLEGYGVRPVGISEEINWFSSFELFQNYPNPFNPVTTISFNILRESEVLLEVYNALGKRVAKLVDSKLRSGNYKIVFDGSILSSGVYFYKLKAEEFVSTKKFVLIK
ncbi:MAG: T9SS type A sorting domain-containing protein [Ignavibacteriales bacterium]|nr:T9SS type A sorting domain-containing protein [Ignavibacteriales bacterium]